MKKSFLVFWIFGSMLIFHSCNRTPDLTNDEIYQVVNEIISDDSLFMNRICSNVNMLPLSGDYIKEFGYGDKRFNKHQALLFKDFRLEPNRLKYYDPKKKVFKFIKIDTICSKGFLYKISFPIIAIDRTKVLIEFTEDCNCMLGGQSGKDLYEKQNGHWKRVKSYDRWISERKVKAHAGNIVYTPCGFQNNLHVHRSLTKSVMGDIEVTTKPRT